MAVATQKALQECAIAIVEMIKSQAHINLLIDGTSGKVQLTRSQYDMVKYNWPSSLGDFTHMMGAEIVIVDEVKPLVIIGADELKFHIDSGIKKALEAYDHG